MERGHPADPSQAKNRAGIICEKEKAIGMFSDQPTPALPVACHLFPKREEIPARLVENCELWAEVSSEPGLENAVVELYVFAGIDRSSKKPTRSKTVRL